MSPPPRATIARVEELLRSMTLDEKIGQMTQVDSKALTDKSDIQKYSIGSVLSGGDSGPSDITPDGWAEAHDECQSWALKTRLAIPLIYGIDAVHGHNKVAGAVIFPHNIGLGATRDPLLVEQAARVTAVEVAGTGIRWCFAPCIAVALNPRWGRTYESFGQDTQLVQELGTAVVKGLQGERLSNQTSILACAKHFVGDGGTRDGVDQGDTRCDEDTLNQIHLPGYTAAIKAGAGSIMVSYNSWNGEKLHGHKYLLTDVLKGRLGFEGILVSDWAAIDQLSPDYKHDVEVSINAGLDMVMIPFGPNQGNANDYVHFLMYLKELVREGKIALSRIDDAVARILRIKIELGLFERPMADRTLTPMIGSLEHRQVARECVRKSLVLLKNEGHVLPLSKNLNRLHVVGQAADDLGIQSGGWTICWQGAPGQVIEGGVSILSAIRGAVGKDTHVTHSLDGSGAAGADAVVVVVGEFPYAEMKGDQKDLCPRSEDHLLIEEVSRANVPVVTLLLSGRPLLLDGILDASDALIAAWLPGSEGQGVADVLFGDAKPTGKLPHAWPRSIDQVGCDESRPAQDPPLFPFGYGLTY